MSYICRTRNLQQIEAGGFWALIVSLF